MKQYFKAPIDKNGNVLQLIVDDETKTIKYGYALFAWRDSIKLSSKKALRELRDTYAGAGFGVIDD